MHGGIHSHCAVPIDVAEASLAFCSVMSNINCELVAFGSEKNTNNSTPGLLPTINVRSRILALPCRMSMLRNAAVRGVGTIIEVQQ